MKNLSWTMSTWNPKANQFLMVGYQLDDSQSLHRKWLEITKHLFINGCLGFQVRMGSFLPPKSRQEPLEAGKNVSRNGVEKETIRSGLRWRKVRVLMACALVFSSSPSNVRKQQHCIETDGIWTHS